MIDWLSSGLTTRQPSWVILCRLPEKGRREIEETVEEMKERDREERKMDESEGTEEIKAFPLYPYLLQGQQALPNCKPISVGHPSDVRYKTSLPHPTTPYILRELNVSLLSVKNKTNISKCHLHKFHPAWRALKSIYASWLCSHHHILDRTTKQSQLIKHLSDSVNGTEQFNTVSTLNSLGK